MTRREAKAVEISKKYGMAAVQALLEMAEWQAQESADNLTVCVLPAMITERQLMAILNAGTEDV